MSISPTRAALLGQLAWRPQTPYELNQALAQHVRFLWPRAHSHVYREMKRLAAQGYARADRGATGRRPRTIYSITDAGLEALREWHASEPGGFALEHEPLLRVLFASSGTRQDLLAAAARARADADDMLALGRRLGGLYLEGTHERQSEVHLRVFTFDFLIRWAALTADWADAVEAEVSRWDNLEPTPERQCRALSRIEALLAAEGISPRDP
jgi:PadR family transcriptional regulator AphA